MKPLTLSPQRIGRKRIKSKKVSPIKIVNINSFEFPELQRNSNPFGELGFENQSINLDKSPKPTLRGLSHNKRFPTINREPIGSRWRHRQKNHFKNLNSIQSKVDYYISPYNKEPLVMKYIDFQQMPMATCGNLSITDLGMDKWR
ncbi:unnamed protein product [Moneuplotes crassus]|uniref:Uncharacterized protein n=1 Tax=Euplotes crassus TaxID=5936 RepID=A0AAD1X739_EUPCR|nr:unnamed protein product [Moneuplotes crassus]